MDNYFQGQDGFIWFTGVVEDRNDPTKLGRVRVRCVGYHTADKTKIPTEDLPWAWVMQTIHTPSMNGMGHTPGFMVEGTWVIGFFRDPQTLQEPIIMGTIPGVPEELGDPNTGFHDPNRRDSDESKPGYNTSVYPRVTGEPDTNRLSRNEKEFPHAILADKRTKQEEYQNIPNRNPFAEPSYAYEAEYPFNHVWESESGHIKEFDDTSDKERIHEYHRTGTYYEVDGGGNRTVKVVGDGYHIIAGSDNLYVGGNCNITVGGNCNMYVKKDWNIQVDGDMNLLVQGNKREEVLCDGETTGFSYEIVKNGKKQISVDGDFTQIYGTKYEEHFLGDVTRNYQGALSEFVTGETERHYTEGLKTFIGTDFEQHITGNSQILVKGTYDLDSTGAMTIDGTTVDINQPSSTQFAARKGDAADSGEGDHGDGSDIVEDGSPTVKIGDTAVKLTPTEPTAAEDEVETSFTASTIIKDTTTSSSTEENDRLSWNEVVDVDIDPVGTLQTELGSDTNIGKMDAIQAREILSGRDLEKTTKDNPQDPDTLESVENGDNDKVGEVLTVQEDSLSSEGFKPYTPANGYNKDGKLVFRSHTDPRISPSLGSKLEELSDLFGQKLTITSAYRSPSYNASVGGASKSTHMRGIAVDILLPNTTVEQRLDFIRKAGQVGIQGIGLYFPSSSGARFIHCDLGGKRQWGPSGSRRSQYNWAKSTLQSSGWYV